MNTAVRFTQKLGWLAGMAAFLSFFVMNPLNLYAEDQKPNPPGLVGGPGAGPHYRHHKSAFHRWVEKNPEAKAKYDMNKDGELDKTERLAAREKWMEEHPEVKEMKAKYDLNKDGKLDKDERAAAQKDWLEKHPNLKSYDKDGDGLLDKTEREAAREEWLKTKPELRDRWDRDNNPPGKIGGPGTNWENRPGPKDGPGASPDKQ